MISKCLTSCSGNAQPVTLFGQRPDPRIAQAGNDVEVLIEVVINGPQPKVALGQLLLHMPDTLRAGNF